MNDALKRRLVAILALFVFSVAFWSLANVA